MKAHLVLGAGGMRTLGFAGALQALQQHGVEFATVSACSAGSFFGACICAGIDTDDLVALVRSMDIKRYVGDRAYPRLFDVLPPLKVFHLRRWPFALYREPGLVQLFRERAGGDPTFGQLELPFSTIGVDLVSSRILVYSRATTPDMKVSEALRIAAAVPFLYPPHSKDGRMVVDGALASHCPVWLALEHADDLPILALTPRRTAESPERQSMPSFVGNLVGLGGASRDSYVIDQIDRVHAIELDCGDVRYDQFDLAPADRDRLLVAGRTAVEDRIKYVLSAAPRAPRAGLASAPAAPSNDDRAERGGLRAMARFNSRLSGQVRNRIFISYAHADVDWLKRFQVFLNPLVRSGQVEIWDDSRIRPGARWREEIEEALGVAKIALLLVTPDFLASDFINDVELQTLLRASREAGLLIVWVLVRDALWRETALGDYQCANDPAQPLSAMSEPQVDTALRSIAEKIKFALA